jgi:hypothetical protein
MTPLKLVVLAFLACAALSACAGKGGEGESCNSSGGVLGSFYCDQELICNGAAGYRCERAGSRHENEACDTGELCATGLWCDTVASKCTPWLSEGDSCYVPMACGPNLACLKTPDGRTPTCAQAEPEGAETDSGIARATVIGTLTFPSIEPAKGMVEIYSVLPPDGKLVASSEIASSGGTSLDYQVLGVPAGTYFIRAYLSLGRSEGKSSTPGDYAAWFGDNGDGNPPAAANAVVPDAGKARFNFSLIMR